jgi:hypothetical protein
MSKSTKTDLVAELSADLDRFPKRYRECVERVIERAKQGVYHDFESHLPMPKVMLDADLRLLGFDLLAEQVRDGEYDEPATEEQAKEAMQPLLDELTKKKGGFTPPSGPADPGPAYFEKDGVKHSYIPRIRGNAIQEANHWTWEMYLTIGPSEPIVLRSNDKFISQLAAINNMKAHSKDLMKLVCETLGAPVPSDVVNLVDGRVEPMEEFAKPKAPEGVAR